MIFFKDVYRKAISLIDDPTIQKAYVTAPIEWEKIMYNYLVAGVAMFNTPTRISFLLQDQTKPEGQIEINDGAGVAEYQLSITPKEHSDYYFTVAGKPDYRAVYNKTANKVVFSDIVPEGSKWSAEWYFPGCFNSNFNEAASSTTPAQVIQNQVEDILARALVLEWAEKEKNFILDIRNVLTDTDFKVYSPANVLRSKVDWAKQMKYDFDSMTNKLSWSLLSRAYHGGKFYG